MTSLRDINLDEIVPDHSVGDDVMFIDGDTLRVNSTGESIRIDNFQAPEIFHAQDPTKPSHAAGSVAHAEFARLARERGFTEVFRTGETDKYGRTIGDLINPDTGQRFSHYILKEGLAPGDFFTDEAGSNQRLIGVGQRASGQARMAEEEDAFQNIMTANGGSFDWKTMSFSEADFNEDIHSATSIRRLDRSIDNKALKQFSTSFDTALMGVAEAYHGFKQMVGDVTGNEALEMSGAIGVARQRDKMMDKAKVTVDIQDVDGVGDFFDYVANNAAMSIPYMANTAGSALVGAGAGAVVGGPVGAVAGGVIGLTSPTAIYSGQVYNGQEEKDATVALTSGFAQAVLDRIGLKGSTAAVKGNLRGILKEAEEELVRKGMTREAAKAAVVNASKKELTGFFDDGLAMARKQLSARNATRTILSRAAKGFGAEAVTEAAQETLAQIGEDWDKDNFGIFDYDGFNSEFINRITNAAVAGGTLGGAFGSAGGIREVGQWADIAHDLGKPKNSFEGTLAAKEDSRSIAVRLAQMQRSDQDSLDVAIRVDNNTEAKKARTASEKAIDSIQKAPYLWRGMIRARLDKDALQRSAAFRQLGSMFGGFLGRIMPGMNYEEASHFNANKHKRIVGEEPKFWYQGYKGIKNDKKASEEFNKDFTRVADDYNKWWESAHDKKGERVQGVPNYDWSKWNNLPTSAHFEAISTNPSKNMWQQFIERLDQAGNSMLASQNLAWSKNGKPGEVLDPKFKKLNNYLLKYRQMKKEAVVKDRKLFEGLLRSEYGLSAGAASDLATRMLEREPMDGVDDNVFDLLYKGVPATSAKARTLALSQNPKFREFFHSDIFHNLNEAARNAARFETYHTYVGKDNWRIAQLLDQAYKEGVPKEQVDHMADSIQKYLEAQSGNYKRPEPGSYGERALGVQKFMLVWSLLTALPLSAWSSTVELALTAQGLTKSQIFGRNGLMEMGNQLGAMIGRGAIRLARESWTGQEHLPTSPEFQMLRRLGFTQWETGAATTVGATESASYSRNLVDKFFRYNGLQGLTNTTRTIRAASFVDAMNGYFQTLENFATDTEAYRYASEQIRNLGVDPETFKSAMTNDPEAESTKAMYDLAMYNWINQAVALPGAANRPLFYQDPRLMLFTQFNGYVATFTANHLPRLWSEYVARGKPSIKFNTFAMMAMMIMLGYASQYLKDWLKYGKPSPYLDSTDKLRRAVNSSGLLGQSERVMNFLWPTFERKASNPVEALGGMVFDEMPAMSPLERLYKATDAFYEGDADQGAYNLWRAAPIVGPLQGLAKELSGVEF